MMEENWGVVVSFFPKEWREIAVSSNALKGLRKDKSEEKLLRTLLIHLACGYSLRETAVRARQAGLADISDVALLKRLRKSKEWLHGLCLALFAEMGVPLEGRVGAAPLRIFDATTVKEPGATGSLWRIHYSVRLPSLLCDFFKITGTEGKGTGESFRQFPVQKGDHIIADRGYSNALGIQFVDSRQGFVIVRLNTQSMPLYNTDKSPFMLLQKVEQITRAGEIQSWPVCVQGAFGAMLPGRLCVVRKTEEAIQIAQKKLRRSASKKGHVLKPQTLVFAQYVMVFTTFPEQDFSELDILEEYRLRWQVELVFKRFKQIAQLGRLPKRDDESAKAWLYGKLFVALLSEKIIAHARSISPWGYDLARTADGQPLA